MTDETEQVLQKHEVRSCKGGVARRCTLSCVGPITGGLDGLRAGVTQT